MSMEEYRQKMELYIFKARIDEEEDLTIARFLSGLNYNIRDRVELLPFQNLNELVQMCIKVEQQKKDSSKSFFTLFFKIWFLKERFFSCQGDRS